jgi:hypothetical protein
MSVARLEHIPGFNIDRVAAATRPGGPVAARRTATRPTGSAYEVMNRCPCRGHSFIDTTGEVEA